MRIKEWIILKNSKEKTNFKFKQKMYQLYFYADSCAFDWNSVRKKAKIAAAKQRHNAKSSLSLSLSLSVDPGPKTESRSRALYSNRWAPRYQKIIGLSFRLSIFLIMVVGYKCPGTRIIVKMKKKKKKRRN